MVLLEPSDELVIHDMDTTLMKWMEYICMATISHKLIIQYTNIASIDRFSHSCKIKAFFSFLYFCVLTSSIFILKGGGEHFQEVV